MSATNPYNLRKGDVITTTYEVDVVGADCWRDTVGNWHFFRTPFLKGATIKRASRPLEAGDTVVYNDECLAVVAIHEHKVWLLAEGGNVDKVMFYAWLVDCSIIEPGGGVSKVAPRD